MSDSTIVSASLSNAERAEAERLWQEYERAHDLSGQLGMIAGIDPKTGNIWIGRWFDDVLAQRDASGETNPLWFERIGQEACLRKGGRR